MAEKTNLYIKAHAVSVQVLAQDPTRRDKLLAELAASPSPNVQPDLRIDPNADHEALLRRWDDAIAEEPTDFTTHVHRVHYCTIAFVYYDRYYLGPATLQHGNKFAVLYNETLCRLMSESLAIGEPIQTNAHRVHAIGGTPPTANQRLSAKEAHDLLSAPEVLLEMSFCHCDEDVPGVWRVFSVNQLTTRDGRQEVFTIVFDDEREKFEVAKGGLMDLLLNSSIVFA
ncbi:hypothetical protein B0H15DRAFT_956270 [Mycena belliarum]|uniref:Uncharacterized protein n=1 Tax=Mycena belliarum TaxID=1033014 RepID=A0AAD6TUR1_9AGAR|nr:hypothetical protein B0H15DRAFT_956270 [Mycena belliae]